MATPETWRSLLAMAEARVGSAHDARRVVERASGWDASELIVHLDEPVTERCRSHAEAMVARREAGEPLQYVVGRWGFRTLDLYVDRRVLIPRPETEVVAGVALDELRRLEGTVAVDLGTGSGAIALSIATETKGVEIWATDASPDALAVARANLAGLGGGWKPPDVRIVEGSWFAALPDDLAGRIDLVVSNPPYVAEADELPGVVRDWEPTTALIAGTAGTECLDVIVDEAPRWLSRPGALVVELAPHQADHVVGRCRAAGFGDVTVHSDLTGRARAVAARIECATG